MKEKQYFLVERYSKFYMYLYGIETKTQIRSLPINIRDFFRQINI